MTLFMFHVEKDYPLHAFGEVALDQGQVKWLLLMRY